MASEQLPGEMVVRYSVGNDDASRMVGSSYDLGRDYEAELLYLSERSSRVEFEGCNIDILVEGVRVEVFGTFIHSKVGLKVEWRLCGTRWVGSGRRSLSSVPAIELFDHATSLCFICRYRERWGRKGVVECDVREHCQVSGMQQ